MTSAPSMITAARRTLMAAAVTAALTLPALSSAMAQETASVVTGVAETTPAAMAPTTVPADAVAAPTDPMMGLPVEAAPAVGPATGLPLDAGPEAAEVENPYGLKALWTQGDFVAKGTLILMIIMSMGTWYIVVTKLLEQSKLLRQATAARRDFWTAGSIRQGAEKLDERSTFRVLVENGLRAAEHHEGNLTDQIDLHSWVTMSLQRQVESVQTRLQNGLAFLATVGSTAPFIGLFGTVWGIYHALVAIGMSGQASIDKVAGPVGEALIMTAIGLAVAVPAVLGYNWLVRRNKAALDQLRSFSADLHAVMLASSRRSATQLAA